MKYSENDLMECFEQIQSISQLYAHSKSRYETLDRLKHYEYEVIASEVDAKTEAERKRLATITPKWRSILKELNKANDVYITSKIEYDTLNTKFDCLRSMLSMNKSIVRKGI